MLPIIPTPKHYDLTDGEVSLAGRCITVSTSCDERIVRAAHVLRREIEALSQCFVTVYQRQEPAPGDIFITAQDEQSEAYTLSLSQEQITLCGSGLPGAYYAIQTLRQMIAAANSLTLPACRVKDEPDFAYRGVYHDVARGRVSTLQTLKELCDQLAYWKINSLQLYVEDAYDFVELDGVMTQQEVLSAEEILELDEYCWEHFVELVPSLSCFGHLYNLLQSDKYRHLCELENFEPQRHYWIEKMARHTIDASNPESLKTVFSMIDQYIGLCRSDKFNICCDETNDLCHGRNRGKEPGDLYFRFVSEIIRHVQSHGKQVMMWGDIVLHHPEKIPELPDGVIMLNWGYDPDPSEKTFQTFQKYHCIQYVCPGTTTWNHMVGYDRAAAPNIAQMSALGHRYGAVGFLNTNWGDYANICSLTGAMLGLAMGAERGWNAGEQPLTDAFDRAFSLHVFGQREENLARLMREISDAEGGAEWQWIVEDVSSVYIEKNPGAQMRNSEKALHEGQIARLHQIMDRLERLGRQNPKINDLYLAAWGLTVLHQIQMYLRGWTDRVDCRAWLDAYEAAWMAESKVSAFALLREFIETVSACRDRDCSAVFDAMRLRPEKRGK